MIYRPLRSLSAAYVLLVSQSVPHNLPVEVYVEQITGKLAKPVRPFEL